VLLGVDGISDFDGLYSGQHNDEIQLYAFDILALDGDDLRKCPSTFARST
jgi:bifunctional non-homologous end joining protein LigD